MRGLPARKSNAISIALRSQEGASPDEYSEVTVRAAGPNEAFRVEKAIRDLGFDVRAVASRFQEARQFFVFMEVLLMPWEPWASSWPAWAS